ncbi:hypothetical protein B0H19DRAFT_1083697 [Mycena capillaripes]|nr:hypothetical protein B0H19DRAFT_1083697 [Mycena capillaripes]
MCTNIYWVDATDIHKILAAICRLVRVFDYQLGIWVDALDAKTGAPSTCPTSSATTTTSVATWNSFGFDSTKRTLKFLECFGHRDQRPTPARDAGSSTRNFIRIRRRAGLKEFEHIIEFWLGALGQSVESVRWGKAHANQKNAKKELLCHFRRHGESNPKLPGINPSGNHYTTQPLQHSKGSKVSSSRHSNFVKPWVDGK